ncbi:hypothetical protein D0N36_18250 [Hymenobacter lapidiphilus]|uniref:hypothetical protein n=1 Tax=Hymenobacter sp. CCM 8763 TaxID=2303334 RepID=UPI000E3502A9|nr:hypothetical protein [Hymenobacter sp. CCM 8763]RFP63629.1 hypothetical protein D0N36_18250 [Hymenobacter sp. CCM 8763]
MMAVVQFLRACWPLFVLVLAACLPLQAQQQPTAGAADAPWVTLLNPQHLGGSIEGTALARDAAGNLYVTGVFTGAVRLGELQLQAPQGSAAKVGFVAQLSPAGRWRWAQVLTGFDGSTNRAESVASDAAGGLYVTGSYQGQVRFGSYLGLEPPSPGGAPSGARHFVARLDTAGHWLWAQALSVGPAKSSQVTSDAAGMAYVNGGPAATGASGLAREVVAGKISPQGAWQWTVRPPAPPPPRVQALAVSPSGHVFLGGALLPSPPVRSPQPAEDGWLGPGRPAGPERPFVARLTATGKWEWTATAQPQGNGRATCEALRVGPDGDLFVAGQYDTPVRFTAVAGRPLQLRVPERSGSVFVGRLTAGGQWRWVTAPTSAGSTFARRGIFLSDLDLDAAGQLCLAGTFAGSAEFSTLPSSTHLSAGDKWGQSYVAWLSPMGRWLAAVTPTASPKGAFSGAAYARAVLATGVGCAVLLAHAPGAATDESDEFTTTLTLGLSQAKSLHPDRWSMLSQADGGRRTHQFRGPTRYGGHVALGPARGYELPP